MAAPAATTTEPTNRGAICDLATGARRSRRRCPYHKHLCYGRLVLYYDTVCMFFDCGTFADYGYGFWHEPEAVTKERRRQARLRRKQRQAGEA